MHLYQLRMSSLSEPNELMKHSCVCVWLSYCIYIEEKKYPLKVVTDMKIGKVKYMGDWILMQVLGSC